MDDTERPDPDQLLARLREDAALAQRGRLKIFFGACAGVGKTCAMLAAARTEQARGTAVLVGVVETHGRADTQALLQGLALLPLRECRHRDKALREFDLDEALRRRPGLILVDELAHANVPGARHPKRWQDVKELLDAGIDVWTTLNVQHLESLNDVVGGVTGVRVQETVPDQVFDEADEVVLVDISPDDLLERLKQGKVYLPPQAERAAQAFFRKGNLMALRELALRRMADRVDDDMQAWRRSRAVRPVWPVRDCLLACIGPGGQGEKTVRSTARLAAGLGVPWHAVHVETPALQRLPDQRRDAVLRVLRLAQTLGAQTAALAGQDVAAALVKYARDHNLSKLVLGRAPAGRRWRWRPSLAERLGARGPELDVIEIALSGARRPAADGKAGAGPTPSSRSWRGHAFGAAACTLAALLAHPLQGVFEPANIVMLFLLAVVATAVRHGRGPAVLAAVLAVGYFDFLFVEPRLSFAVKDIQYLFTLVVMLVVALLIGQMTAGLTYQARVAQRREDRMRALYEMSRDLSGALLTEQVEEVAARFLKAEFGARAALLLARPDDTLRPPEAGEGRAEVDLAVAQWCFRQSQEAGQGTDTLPGAPVLYVPLRAPMRVRGVLAVQPDDPRRLAVPEQRRLLQTCASLLGMAIERIHYVNVAQDSTVEIESERLRNSLLAAVSHDLRTPLASVVGLADALAHASPPLPPGPAAMADDVHQAALRMSALVSNLMDMARLQSGAVQLNLQWQPVEEVIGAAVAGARGLLGERAVHVTLAAGLPFVRIDAVLLERVLANLLENAAKYTPDGTQIRLDAHLREGALEVWVDDDGPGLPPGREEAVFRKFERGHKESATPGVGLGLALCRAILQAHGGTIEGATRPEGGARITLRLPGGQPPHLTDADPTLPP